MSLIESPAVDVQPGARNWMNRADWVTAEVLYERYLKDVFRYVVQRVPSIEEAEDITAEVFAAATMGLSRFRGDCSPYLWLLSIARRQVARGHRRRASRRETLASDLADEASHAATVWESIETVEGPESALLRADARRELTRLLTHLNPDQQEALRLHYMERLSVAEIAVVMGRTLGAVTSLLHRARARLYRDGRDYFLETDEGQTR